MITTATIAMMMARGATGNGGGGVGAGGGATGGGAVGVTMGVGGGVGTTFSAKSTKIEKWSTYARNKKDITSLSFPNDAFM